MTERLGARPWPSYHRIVARILRATDLVLAYNAGFDHQLSTATAERYRLRPPESEWRCLMPEYARTCADRRIKLSETCEREDVTVGDTHRAPADARLAWPIMLSIDHSQGEL